MDRTRLEHDGRPVVIAAKAHFVGVATIEEHAARCPPGEGAAVFLAPFVAGGQPEADLLRPSSGDLSGETEAMPAIGCGVDDTPEPGEPVAPVAAPSAPDTHRL